MKKGMNLALAVMLCGATSVLAVDPPPAKGTKVDGVALGKKGEWVELSVTIQEKKCNITALAVDRVNGDVYILPMHGAVHAGGGKGIWKSTDRGVTFVKMDSDDVTGGGWNTSTIDMDPAGGKLAVFCMFGRCALTLDGGTTWRRLGPDKEGVPSKHLDWGSVDWDDPAAQTIMVAKHERSLAVTIDGGQNWQELGFRYTNGGGVFDAKAILVFHGGPGIGIGRSEDLGKTWEPVSKDGPSNLVLKKFKGKGYLLSGKGLMVSEDKGKTWKVQGVSPEKYSWNGPYFGKDEKHIFVLGYKDIHETTDGGATWVIAAPLAQPGKGPNGNNYGASTVFGYDSKSDIMYTAAVNNPVFRYERGSAK